MRQPSSRTMYMFKKGNNDGLNTMAMFNTCSPYYDLISWKERTDRVQKYIFENSCCGGGDEF